MTGCLPLPGDVLSHKQASRPAGRNEFQPSEAGGGSTRSETSGEVSRSYSVVGGEGGALEKIKYENGMEFQVLILVKKN